MVLEKQVKKNKNTIYVPDVARITRIEKLSATEKVFKIVFDDEEKRNSFSFKPGQFVELTNSAMAAIILSADLDISSKALTTPFCRQSRSNSRWKERNASISSLPSA